MPFPIALPELATTIDKVPSEREDKAERGENQREPGLVFRCLVGQRVSRKRGSNEGPKVGPTLPVQLNLKLSDVQRIRKSSTCTRIGFFDVVFGA